MLLMLVCPMLTGKTTFMNGEAYRTMPSPNQHWRVRDSDALVDHAALVDLIGPPDPDWTPTDWLCWNAARNSQLVAALRKLRDERTILMVHSLSIALELGDSLDGGAPCLGFILLPLGEWNRRARLNPDRAVLASMNRREAERDWVHGMEKHWPSLPEFYDFHVNWPGRFDAFHDSARRVEV